MTQNTIYIIKIDTYKVKHCKMSLFVTYSYQTTSIKHRQTTSTPIKHHQTSLFYGVLLCSCQTTQNATYIIKRYIQSKTSSFVTYSHQTSQMKHRKNDVKSNKTPQNIYSFSGASSFSWISLLGSSTSLGSVSSLVCSLSGLTG